MVRAFFFFSFFLVQSVFSHSPLLLKTYDQTKTPVASEVDSHQWDLIPVEKEIPGFPEPIAENETDLNVLGDYYEAVAQAYKAWGEKNQSLAREISEKNHKETHALKWKVIRAPGAADTSVEKGRSLAIQYNNKQHSSYADMALVSFKKAEFYEGVGKTCTEVRGDIERASDQSE